MCGIAGRINFEKSHSINPKELKDMTDVIAHRGPDDEGHYINENIGLGFRRLSIIDLSTGHQPLSNEQNDIWITFNGEVYNYQTLRSDLIKLGYKFKTNSDTEVILASYIHYGEECVKHLRGMFAFVIWDDKKKQLFGARDHLGIKPFYYYMDNNSFIWASEIKAINQVKGLRKNISLSALDTYFTYGYIIKSQSIYEEIRKLEPAHYFILRPHDSNKLTIRKYWTTKFAPEFDKSEQYWVDSIQELLAESVKLQMVSDVPLGAFLSGGIDSSSVVALMSKASERPISTFSIGFKEKKFNELEYARILAAKYKTDHHELIIEPESISILPKMVQAYDEPFADSSAIPTYFVSKFARQHVTVALSGDGGDELFAGYESYPKMLRIRNSKFLSSAVVRQFARGAGKLLPDHLYGKGFMNYLSHNDDTIGAYFCLWKYYERKKLFHGDLLNQLYTRPSEVTKAELLKGYEGDFLSRNQQLDIETYMVDDVLTKVDRVSMLTSLEVRVPILDHKFAELSFRIPSSLKLKDNQTKKYIFKKAMSSILPEEVITHKKQGFSMPFKLWFKNDLEDYLRDTLTESSPISQYINRDYLTQTFKNHKKGMRDFSGRIWSLMFLDSWLKQNK